MKLSELSKREYVAIEIVGSLYNQRPGWSAETAAKQAFAVADALIAHEGKPKRDHEFEAMQAEVERLRTSNEVLRNLIPRNKAPEAVALEQIWGFLGVANQTAAMQMLRDAFPELVK